MNDWQKWVVWIYGDVGKVKTHSGLILRCYPGCRTPLEPYGKVFTDDIHDTYIITDQVDD